MRKNLIWWRFIKFYIKLGLHGMYISWKINGIDKIPVNKPVILCLNHQNSFLDAFWVTCHTSSFMHYLSRAKAFSNPVMKWVLETNNLRPIYRVRDGIRNVQKNEEVFTQSYEFLKRGDSILIFPEANHNPQRYLRPLSKGFTRIVFGACEELGWESGLQVIPIGVNYSDFTHVHRHVQVNTGKPILMDSSWKERYETDPNEAITAIKNEVEEQLRSLIVDIPKPNFYDIHQLLMDELEADNSKLISREKIQPIAEAISSLPEIEELNPRAESLLKKTQKLGLSIRNLNTPVTVFDWMRVILGLPVLLNNALPHYFTKWFISSSVKDKAFQASIKILFGIFIFPLFYFIIALLLLPFFGLAVSISYLAISFILAHLHRYIYPAFARISDQFTFARLRESTRNEISGQLRSFRSIREKILVRL